MPEWVYWVGWLAVPVALVALSGWWHEREQFNDLHEWFDLLQDELNDVRTMNEQLRRELNRVESEHGDLMRKVARTRPHLVGGDHGVDLIDIEWPTTGVDVNQESPVGPILLGTWPADDLRRAFVSGAAWWEYHTQNATMWPSDRRIAEDEAERRYPGGVLGEDQPRKRLGES